MEERIIKLEDRVAFLEHDLEQLDAVVRELADRLDAMSGDLVRFRDELVARLEHAEEPDEDDAPA